jgi:hypothetical protein
MKRFDFSLRIILIAVFVIGGLASSRAQLSNESSHLFTGKKTSSTTTGTDPAVYIGPNFGIEYCEDCPKKYTGAAIYIHAMSGAQVKTYPLGGTVKISARELAAGMYIYTLVVDGKQVDSKKMILTN